MKAIINKLNSLAVLPRIVAEALKLYGIKELSGSKSNPTILAWAKETKTKDDDWYNNDATPWCGLFIGVVAQRAGKELPKENLRALAWAKFGTPVKEAVLGDVLVFKRTGGGHVGLYVGESADSYFVLGGNQADAVTIMRIAKSRLYSINRPIYNIGAPATAVKYFYSNEGSLLSTNEA